MWSIEKVYEVFNIYCIELRCSEVLGGKNLARASLVVHQLHLSLPQTFYTSSSTSTAIWWHPGYCTGAFLIDLGMVIYAMIYVPTGHDKNGSSNSLIVVWFLNVCFLCGL